MILTFFWITTSLGAQDFPPYFKDFFLGNSLSQVQETLKKHQSYLNLKKGHFFVLDIPLFLYLSPLKDQGVGIDLQNKRVYIDQTHFFDFTKTPLETSAFQFYYQDPYYYLSFKEIVSYEAHYPSRINPNLLSLKLKFFKNQLYAIEYEAKLKNQEINRLKQKYLENFGQKLEKEENTFLTSTGMYIVKIHPNNGKVKIIQMSLSLYQQLELEMESQIFNLLAHLTQDIQTKLNKTLDLKELLYQDRKNILKEKIRQTYRWVDEL